jgi:CheY-like chemotaxis protein
LRVLQAADAREAIARLRGLDETARPTVLLCDIALPGENGYGLLARIRRPEDEAGRTPQARMLAFAPSAFTRAEDRQRSLEAGFHEHLGKPLSQPDRVAPRGPAEMSVPEVRDPGKSGPGRRANP